MSRLISVCIYYDERASWLGQHLASLAPICRDFVYVDGAYATFPGGLRRPASDVEAAAGLHEMAEVARANLLHYRPSSPFFGEQVEKRNMSLDLARSLPGVLGDLDTWFLVTDADELATWKDPSALDALDLTDLNVAEVGAVTVMPEDTAVPIPRSERDKVLHVRSIFRNLPGLRYGPAHGFVTYPSGTGARAYLRGGATMGIEPSLDLSGYIRVEHRRVRRDPERDRAAKTYYGTREIVGSENGVA